MQVQPYLSFEGRAEEAIEFYKSGLGAKVTMLMRYKDAPPEACGPGTIPPGGENKVMHASLRIGDSVVMASDGHCSGKASFQGISLTLAASNDAEAQKLFRALSNGGSVTMPLTKTFFASSFGMITDRFGVSWMIIAGQ
jgi:PhnB protein